MDDDVKQLPPATLHAYAQLYNSIQALRLDVERMQDSAGRRASTSSFSSAKSTSFAREIPRDPSPLHVASGRRSSKSETPKAILPNKTARESASKAATPLQSRELKKRPSLDTPSVVDRLMLHEAEKQAKIASMRIELSAKKTVPEINPESRRIVEKKQRALSSSSSVQFWEELKSKEGYTFYHNTQTGATQWEKPEGYRSKYSLQAAKEALSSA